MYPKMIENKAYAVIENSTPQILIGQDILCKNSPPKESIILLTNKDNTGFTKNKLIKKTVILLDNSLLSNTKTIRIIEIHKIQNCSTVIICAFLFIQKLYIYYLYIGALPFFGGI